MQLEPKYRSVIIILISGIAIIHILFPYSTDLITVILVSVIGLLFIVRWEETITIKGFLGVTMDRLRELEEKEVKLGVVNELGIEEVNKVVKSKILTTIIPNGKVSLSISSDRIFGLVANITSSFNQETVVSVVVNDTVTDLQLHIPEYLTGQFSVNSTVVFLNPKDVSIEISSGESRIIKNLSEMERIR